MSATFEQARTHFFQGNDHFEAGRFEAAEASFEAALALAPGRASTLANLGAARLALGKTEAALSAFEQSLAVEPDDLETWLHKGVALLALGRHADALATFDDVVGRRPDFGAGWWRRGQALQHLGRHAEALTAYDRAVALDPDLGEAWSLRGGVLREQQRLDEAARSYEQAIAHGADAELNRYFLASVSGREQPASAPPAYVEPLFDDYAETFEQHLVGALNYRGHAILVEQLRALGEKTYASAVDLGCGTGLCGALLRPLVERLDGVDLSRRMLAKADALGIYAELVHGDAIEYLRRTERRHDLVVAADVFIYIGDLDAAFEGVRRVARPGALFCFSAERGADAADYALLPSLRYAHSKRYLAGLAQRHGFATRHIAEAPLREDQRRPVPGLYVFLEAP
jgi:predicted TPR repeat methyltransferase